MIATLVIETSLATYTFWRYKLESMTKLAITTLICLASFQLAEYFVCTGYGTDAERWSRLGFIMITALPPLAVHMMHKIADKPVGKLVYGSYGVMATFMVFFLTYHAAFIGHQCAGNYVIFQLGNQVGGAYSVYYYSILALGIGLGTKWINDFNKEAKKHKHQLQALKGLISGYLVFLIPAAVFNTLIPASRQAIPSVMCGFAVLYALILTLYIVPRMVKQKAVESDYLKKI